MSRILIRGAAVVTIDPALGDFERADILIEDGVILDVRPGIEADAEVIDASTMIAMPAWSTPTVTPGRRPCAASSRTATSPTTCAASASRWRRATAPKTCTSATNLGALDALNYGVTSIVDYCHNILDPDCAHAAVSGLLDAGIRGLYGHGMTPILENKWSESKGGTEGAAESESYGRRSALAREIKSQYFSSDAQAAAVRARAAGARDHAGSPRSCASSRSRANSGRG